MRRGRDWLAPIPDGGILHFESTGLRPFSPVVFRFVSKITSEVDGLSASRCFLMRRGRDWLTPIPDGGILHFESTGLRPFSPLRVRNRASSLRPLFGEALRAAFSCGEGGIRTLGTGNRHTRFPGVPLKPLGHLSEDGRAKVKKAGSWRQCSIGKNQPQLLSVPFHPQTAMISFSFFSSIATTLPVCSSVCFWRRSSAS